MRWSPPPVRRSEIEAMRRTFTRALQLVLLILLALLVLSLIHI